MLFAGGSKSGPVFLYRVLIHGVCVYIYILLSYWYATRGKPPIFFFFFLPSELPGIFTHLLFVLFCFSILVPLSLNSYNMRVGERKKEHEKCVIE